MNVLHLISSGGMYGAETMLLNLACAQTRLGLKTTVGVFRNKRAPHTEVALEGIKRGLPVEIIHCKSRFDRKPLKTIEEFIREQDVSVIHTHGYKSNFYGYFSARRCGAPFVATCHLWTHATASVRVYEFLDSLILRGAEKVVGVSDAIVQALGKSGIPTEKLSMIYNGADLRHYKGVRPTLRDELGLGSQPLIGAVCRLEHQKGLEYVIRAFQGVLAEFPDARVVVAGEGSLRQQLGELIRDLDLEKRVLLLGSRTDMAEVYASLDLFVLGSIDEGMPMTILEALSAEKPVVATRVGAVEKLIIPRETGLLVEARDVEGLRDAMLQCLRDPVFACCLGIRGSAHVQRFFSAERMAKEYLAVYEQAVRTWTTKHASLTGQV